MFPYIIIGLAAYFLYNQTTTLVDSINFTPKSFKLNKNSFGLFETTGVMSLNISNNSNVKANIDSIVGKILANGMELGRYEILTPFNIPAKNNVNLDVKVYLYNTDVFTLVKNFIGAGKTPKFSLTGNIRTALGNFNFENVLFNEVKVFKKSA